MGPNGLFRQKPFPSNVYHKPAFGEECNSQPSHIEGSMKNLISIVSLSLLGAFSSASQAANVVDNNTVTILNSSSVAFGGYGQASALDNSFSSDFASASLGIATHLDFDFGTALTFSQIQYTDRTSSGGVNNNFAFGIYDYVTKYQYIFSNDASFSNVVGAVVKQVTVPSVQDLANFTHIDSVPGITAQYVRWQVLATNGVNPGAANFQFAAAPVPEPETYVMLLAGLGLMVGVARSRKQKQ